MSTTRPPGTGPGQEIDGEAHVSMWHLPGFRTLTAAFTLARLPVNVVALTIVLATLKRTDSVQVAGWAEAAYIVGMALGTPVAGRLVDRAGTRIAVQVTGWAHIATLLALAAAAFGWTPTAPVVFLVLAAVAGATAPPAGPVIRTAWNDLVPARDLPKVNALESTLSHGFYVAGAAAVAAATWLGQLGSVFVACAALNAGAIVLLLRCAGAVHLPKRGHPAPVTAVFRQPGAARVLTAIFGWALTLGSVEYTVIGWCEATGRENLTGAIVGITAVGAMAGSAVLGGRHSSWWGKVPTTTWMLVWAAALIPFAVLAHSGTPLWALVGVAVLGRLPSAGGFTALIAETTNVATEGLRTETFAWRMTIHLAGSGLGAAVFGTVAEHLGTTWSVWLGIGCAVAVAGVLTTGRR